MNTSNTFLLRFYPILIAFFVFIATGHIRIYAQTDSGSTGASSGGDVDIDVNVKTDDVWYMNWWAWVIGLAVFIIIIVAIVSAGKK